MNQHKINDAWNFIGGWYIDEFTCDYIVHDFNERKEYQKQAHSARGYTVIHSTDMHQVLMDQYRFKVMGVLREYCNLYHYAKETIESFSIADPWNVQKYEPGKHYSVWHCENNGNPAFRKRHLAFMTYLNDVTDAGETEFLYQYTKIRPEKGLTLIWPAHWTHIHRGIPSSTQEKYVTTGWFEFFDTENFLDSLNGTGDDDFYKGLDDIHRNVA